MRLTEGFAQAGSRSAFLPQPVGVERGTSLLGGLQITAGSGIQECGEDSQTQCLLFALLFSFYKPSVTKSRTGSIGGP